MCSEGGFDMIILTLQYLNGISQIGGSVISMLKAKDKKYPLIQPKLIEEAIKRRCF